MSVVNSDLLVFPSMREDQELAVTHVEGADIFNKLLQRNQRVT